MTVHLECILEECWTSPWGDSGTFKTSSSAGWPTLSQVWTPSVPSAWIFAAGFQDNTALQPCLSVCLDLAADEQCFAGQKLGSRLALREGLKPEDKGNLGIFKEARREESPLGF